MGGEDIEGVRSSALWNQISYWTESRGLYNARISRLLSQAPILSEYNRALADMSGEISNIRRELEAHLSKVSRPSESPREASNVTRTLLGLMSFDELRSAGLASVFVALTSKLILGSKSSHAHDPHQSLRLKCLQECLRRLPQGPSELDPETCHRMDLLLCKYGGAGREKRLQAIESECNGILQRVIKSDLLPRIDGESTAAADRFELFRTIFGFLPLESQASILEIWRGQIFNDGAPRMPSMLSKQNWDAQVHMWVKSCQSRDASYITIALSYINHLFFEELDVYLSLPFLHARANEILIQGISKQATRAGSLIFLTVLNMSLQEVSRTGRHHGPWSYFFFNPGLPTPVFQALVQLLMQAGSEWCCLFWVESRCCEILDGYLDSDQEEVWKLWWKVMLQFPEAYCDFMSLEKQSRDSCHVQCQRKKESGKHMAEGLRLLRCAAGSNFCNEDGGLGVFIESYLRAYRSSKSAQESEHSQDLS